MGNSLQDQLLKAGVGNKQQAQKANSEKRKQRKRKRKGGTAAADEAALMAQRAREEKVSRDRELNRRQQQAAQEKAIAAQIRQLIEMNRLSWEEGNSTYNFVDGTVVCKLDVSDEIYRRLGRGQLSIVRYGPRYEVVPTRVADKISERDDSLVVVRNASGPGQTDPDAAAAGPIEDDPYADYQVPDDLKW